MSTDAHLETWREIKGRVMADLKLGSHAIVAVDLGGEVYWGADFAYEPKKLLRYLDVIRHDVKQYIKKQEREASDGKD